MARKKQPKKEKQPKKQKQSQTQKQTRQKQSQQQIVNVRISNAPKRSRESKSKPKTEREIAAEDYLQPRQLAPIIFQTGGFNLPQAIRGTPSPGVLPISQMPTPSPALARDQWQDVGVGREGFVEILELPSKRETLDRLTQPVEPAPSVPLSSNPTIDTDPFPTPRQPSLEGIIEPTARAGIPSFPSQTDFRPGPSAKPFREAAMEDVPTIFKTTSNLQSQTLPSGGMDISLSDKPFREPISNVDIPKKRTTKPELEPEEYVGGSKPYKINGPDEIFGTKMGDIPFDPFSLSSQPLTQSGLSKFPEDISKFAKKTTSKKKELDYYIEAQTGTAYKPRTKVKQQSLTFPKPKTLEAPSKRVVKAKATTASKTAPKTTEEIFKAIREDNPPFSF